MMDVWSQVVVFFSDGQFATLTVATLVLFLLMFITWWTYKSLSDKNLFNFLKKHDVFRLEKPSIIDHILHFVRYVVLFPLYSFAGFLIFALALYILIKPESAGVQQNIFLTSIVLLSTIRIGAYVSASLAEDLAKLVPLSMLGLLITSRSALESLGVSLENLREFVLSIPASAKYLVFIVMLEVFLRLASKLFGGRAGFEPETGSA